MRIIALCMAIGAICIVVYFVRESGFDLDIELFGSVMVGALGGLLVGLVAWMVLAACGVPEKAPYQVTNQSTLIQVMPDTYVRLNGNQVTYQTANAIETVNISSVTIEYSDTETPNIRKERYKIANSKIRWLLGDMDAKTETIITIPEGSLR